MGLDEILANIEKETDESVRRIMSDADGQAERIIGEADAVAKKHSQSMEAKARNDANQLVAREVSKASIASKMAYYEEVDRRVGAALDGIAEGLKDYVKSQEYKKLLASLAEKARLELGSDCTMLVQRSDAEALKHDKKDAAIGIAEERFSGGLKASSADGKREVDYTLETLLERLRDKVAIHLLGQIRGMEE